MESQENTPKIIGRSCKFASTHTVNRKAFGGKWRDDRDDLLVIKEELLFEDGTSKPNLRLIENFKRPFWITKKANRNHRSKKEWEDLDKVQEFMSTQTDLNDNVCRALEKPLSQGSIRVTNRNPYVYGTDMTAAVWARLNYAVKYPEQHGSPNSVCFYDIETDVLGDFVLDSKDKEEFGDAIIGITCSYISNNEKKSWTGTLRRFVEKKTRKPEEEYWKVFDSVFAYIRQDPKEDKKNLGVKCEFEMFDTEKELLIRAFEKLHRWQPDMVSSWNISFDVPRTIERAKANKINPAELFSDPRIPDKYKCCEFIEDPGSKTSDSNKTINKLFYQCWHMVKAPATFRWIDACAVYWYIRKHNGNLKSAALDYVLKEEIKRGKFEIEEAEKYVKLEKHIFMQRNYPVHYMVYNSFDCLGLLEMENKKHDISIALAGAMGVSELEQVPSNPKKLMNNFMKFLYFDRRKVLGSTSDQMADDLDKYIVPQSGWISTLPTNSLEYTGIRCIKELPELPTKVYVFCADLDVKSSYPTTGIFANISRETTVLELSSIEGVLEHNRYLVGLNLMGGNVNAVSFCQRVYGMPTLDEIREKFRSSRLNFDKDIPF